MLEEAKTGVAISFSLAVSMADSDRWSGVPVGNSGILLSQMQGDGAGLAPAQQEAPQVVHVSVRLVVFPEDALQRDQQPSPTASVVAH